VLALSPLIACDKEPESAGATCASNCKKSVALACPNEAYSDEATCESQCEEQIAGCSDNAIVQAYLDCVETTPMTCGETTGTATSDQCLSEGLAFFACLQGLTPDTDGGTEGTGSMEGTSGDPGAVEPPPIPTAGSGEIAVAVRVGDTTEDFRCTAGSGQTSSITYQPGSNGLPDSLSIICQLVEDPQLWTFSVVVLVCLARRTSSTSSAHARSPTPTPQPLRPSSTAPRTAPLGGLPGRSFWLASSPST